jgi:hypothetical protein
LLPLGGSVWATVGDPTLTFEMPGSAPTSGRSTLDMSSGWKRASKLLGVRSMERLDLEYLNFAASLNEPKVGHVEYIHKWFVRMAGGGDVMREMAIWVGKK